MQLIPRFTNEVNNDDNVGQFLVEDSRNVFGSPTNGEAVFLVVCDPSMNKL